MCAREVDDVKLGLGLGLEMQKTHRAPAVRCRRQRRSRPSTRATATWRRWGHDDFFCISNPNPNPSLLPQHVTLIWRVLWGLRDGVVRRGIVVLTLALVAFPIISDVMRLSISVSTLTLTLG